MCSALPMMNLRDLNSFMPQSFARPCDDLAESIKSLGLISPIIIFQNPHPTLLAGQRRCEVLLEMGINEAPVLNLGELPLVRAAAISLADNVSRGWNEAEKVLLWRFLEDNFNASQAADLSKALGFDRSQKLRQWASLTSKLPIEILKEVAADKLDLETTARLARWSDKDFSFLWPIFKELEPSKQKKKLWMDYLEDLSRIEGREIFTFLQEKPFCNLLEMLKEKGRSKTEEEGRTALWRRRYPLLSALSERRSRQINMLEIDKNLKLDLDWSFEDISFKLSFDFSSADEFIQRASSIDRLAEQETLKELFQDDDSLLPMAKGALR